MMSMARDRRVRLAAGAILGATFVGGVALGFVLDRGVAQASPDRERTRVVDAPPAPPPNEWIIDRLSLSPDQRESIDSVIAHYGTVMTSLQREYRPRFQSVVDSANLGLRGILTPDQAVHYDSLAAEMQRRRNRGASSGRR